jgi:hypothetical protein
MTSIAPGGYSTGYQTQSYQFELPPTVTAWHTQSSWQPAGMQMQWSGSPNFGNGASDPFAGFAGDPMTSWMADFARSQYQQAMSPYGPGWQMNEPQMHNVMDSVFGSPTQYYGGGYTPATPFSPSPGYGQQPYMPQPYGQQPFGQQPYGQPLGAVGGPQDPGLNQLAQQMTLLFG